MMKNQKSKSLALLGVTAVVAIAALVLLFQGELTGNLVRSACEEGFVIWDLEYLEQQPETYICSPTGTISKGKEEYCCHKEG